MLYLSTCVLLRGRRGEESVEHVGPEPWRDDQATLNELVRPGMTPLCSAGDAKCAAGQGNSMSRAGSR